MKLIVDGGTAIEQTTLFASMKYSYISEVLTARWTYSFETIKIISGGK